MAVETAIALAMPLLLLLPVGEIPASDGGGGVAGIDARAPPLLLGLLRFCGFARAAIAAAKRACIFGCRARNSSRLMSSCGCMILVVTAAVAAPPAAGGTGGRC